MFILLCFYCGHKIGAKNLHRFKTQVELIKKKKPTKTNRHQRLLHTKPVVQDVLGHGLLEDVLICQGSVTKCLPSPLPCTCFISTENTGLKLQRRS